MSGAKGKAMVTGAGWETPTPARGTVLVLPSSLRPVRAPTMCFLFFLGVINPKLLCDANAIYEFKAI